MHIEHHTIERDGYHWHVVTSGPVDAPPVLLLHCWTGCWEVWQPTMQHFDGQYRFIVPDHLGFGKSDKPRGNQYGIDRQAERSHFLLEAFGVERARVVGHSMGGQIALTLAGAYPEVVERLVVVAPAVTGKLHPLSVVSGMWYGLAQYGIEWHLRATVKLVERFPSLGIQAMRMYFPRPSEQPEAALYWAKRLTADGHIHSAAWARKAFLSWDVTPLLPCISAPALAIWGSADYSIPISECDVLAARIPDFRAVRIAGVGHFPMIEAWQQYTQAVEQFLQPEQLALL